MQRRFPERTSGASADILNGSDVREDQGEAAESRGSQGMHESVEGSHREQEKGHVNSTREVTGVVPGASDDRQEKVGGLEAITTGSEDNSDQSGPFTLPRCQEVSLLLHSNPDVKKIRFFFTSPRCQEVPLSPSADKISIF